MKNKDFLMAGIAGFLTAIFLLPIFKNIKITAIGYLMGSVVIGLPVLWIFAIAIGKFLSRWLSWIYQFAKFCIVGFLNATIDFGILNLLSLYTGLTSGLIIGGVNIPGFMAAATNSYFWNKFWVFSHKRKEGPAVGGASEPAPPMTGQVNYRDLPTFAIVVISGAVINSGVVIFLSTYVSPFFGMSAERWLNVAKVIASAVALAWNFVGFKFLVFNKKQ